MITELTKNDFVNYMNEIQNAYDVDCSIDEIAYNKGIQFQSNISQLGDVAINLLTKIMHDDLKHIEYFIYELDFGRLYQEGDFLDENDNPVDISTPEKLYDYLISFYDEE